MRAGATFGEFFDCTMSKEEWDQKVEPFYGLMANYIAMQKKRLGGTFTVAHAVATKNGRTILRNKIGSNLVFIVLHMTKECQQERLQQRHGDNIGEGMENINSYYEPAEDDEENTFNLTIDKGMTENDVMQKVLDIVKELK